MEPKSPSKAKLPILGSIQRFRVLKLATTIVILILLILIGYYLIRNPDFNNNTSYFSVVLDCGSSGTRVNVYEWSSKQNSITNSNPNLPILLHSFPDNSTKIDRKDGCSYHCKQTEPGLDKFFGNASGIRASIEPLIRRAEKWIPYEKHKDTPIFVLATAGLRRLNRNISRIILDDVEAIVKLHEFKYRKDWIRVLSGREEAYYGWIALNYHMNIFSNSTKSSTLGLLDLGGSSLQVTTEIKDPMVDNPNNNGVFRSKIGSFDYQILADSLPDFGLNEAFDRTVVMLSHSNAFKERDLGIFEIGHPCLENKFIQNYTCHGCFHGNLTNQTIKKNVFSLLLVGEPNWEKCKVLAKAAAVNSSSFDWSKSPNSSYCTGLSSTSDQNALNLVKGTHSVTRFHALSGFFAVYNLLNMNESTNLSKIWEKGEDLCSRSLTGLTDMPNVKHKYAAFLCFRVPYMVSIIDNVLCVGDKEIIFGPGDVSWTLGASLIERKDSWLSDNFRARSIIFSLRFKRVVFSPYSLFVFLVLILFVVYRSQIKLPMLGRKVASLPSYIGQKRRPA